MNMASYGSLMKMINNIFVQKQNEKTNIFKVLFNLFLVLGAVFLLFVLSIMSLGLVLDFSSLLKYKHRIIAGFILTLKLSFVSMGLSLFIGLISALLYQSKILVIRYFINIYIKFIRGTPLIMQIYLFYYIIGTAWGIENRFLAGVLILSSFEGAYIAEIIRGSLLSLDKMQLDAAKSVGFTKMQTVRLVILPQLVQRTLPALTGQFASIIKDSSLLSLIAVIELTQTIRETTAQSFRLFESYLLLGLLYLLITLPISYISKALENKYSIARGE